MKIAILTANLGNFDTYVPNTIQNISCTFHCFDDNNFKPIIGLTPRLQYRIPKLFGWEMFPGYDYYIWLDGSFTMQREDSVKWFLDNIKHKNSDMLVFKHPWRNTIQEEVKHIEDYLQKGDKYITPRYKNGLHLEQYTEILKDPNFQDTQLFTSTAFMYKNTRKMHMMMKDWWYYQSRYFTCDQIVLPYVIFKNYVKVQIINQNQYKLPYLSLTSKHK